VPDGLATTLDEVDAAGLVVVADDDVSELFSSPPQPATTVAPTNTAAIAKPVAVARMMIILNLGVCYIYPAASPLVTLTSKFLGHANSRICWRNSRPRFNYRAGGPQM